MARNDNLSFDRLTNKKGGRGFTKELFIAFRLETINGQNLVFI